MWLKVNGEIRQSGDPIMSAPPSGVGPVKRGDKLHGHVAGVGDLQLAVI